MNKSMTDYRINILYSEEAKQHIAEIPDLRGCSASGETPVEAVREVLIGNDCGLTPDGCMESRSPSRVTDRPFSLVAYCRSPERRGHPTTSDLPIHITVYLGVRSTHCTY